MMKALRFRFMVAALCVLFVTVVAQSRAADASPSRPRVATSLAGAAVASFLPTTST